MTRQEKKRDPEKEMELKEAYRQERQENAYQRESEEVYNDYRRRMHEKEKRGEKKDRKKLMNNPNDLTRPGFGDFGLPVENKMSLAGFGMSAEQFKEPLNKKIKKRKTYFSLPRGFKF